ncbi:MAG: GTPase Era [Candidatus Gastranaerophilales bacterium]|nr:GTPase Era [Candidatus Gastranaerophilales bacterium]
MKSGFTAIIGRPNVGKSTLLNQILEQKIVIATNKAQTTRKRIKGIYTTSDYQIVFVDTPGIHKPLNKLGEFLLDEAKVSVPDADVVLFLVDVSTPAGKGDRWIVENVLANVNVPVIMVLNKTDKASPKKIDENILSYKDLYPNAIETIRISAKTGKNKSKLVDAITKYLPDGEMLYPEDIVTEENMRSIVEEIVREKILINTQDEIPHSVAVKVDEYKEDEDIDRIRATIFCEQKSQKGILIGKNGSLLKLIGTQARQDLEKIVEKKVFLGLQVKIEKDWRKKDKILKNFGYVTEEK